MKYYHYTSLDTFKKMLEKSIETDKYGETNIVIQATHSKFLNDPTETRLFKEALLKAVTNFAKSKGEDLSEAEIEKFNYYYSIDGVFIFSLSVLEDNLIMWRGYGDNGRGVCLEFDFTPSTPTNQDGIIYPIITPEECIYVNPDDFDIDHEIIEKTYNTLKSKQDTIKAAGKIAFGHRYGAIHKHEDYKSEQEFRIVLCDDSKTELREGTLIPHVKYPIPVQYLKRVIIGPRANVGYTKDLLSIVMRVKYIDTIQIERSKVNYK